MEHWLTRAAAIHPDRPAVDGLSYRDLLAAARVAAGGLRERGVQRGERVALALAPGGEFVAALHGCFLAGAVAVPIDVRLSAAERAQRAQGAALVVEPPPDGSEPIAWSYENPHPQVAQIAGLIAFYQDKVTVALGTAPFLPPWRPPARS